MWSWWEKIIPVVIWWLSVIHGKNTFRSLGALNFRKLLSRTRNLYSILVFFFFWQMLDSIIFGNNFFFRCVAGRMRCASFDKVAISSCLCHLSVQAISLFFPFLSLLLALAALVVFLLALWRKIRAEWLSVCGRVSSFGFALVIYATCIFSTRNGIGWLWLRLISRDMKYVYV